MSDRDRFPRPYVAKPSFADADAQVKRHYCPTCGQPHIEHLLQYHEPGEHYPLPRLLTRSNTENFLASEGVITSSIAITAVGVALSTPIARLRDLDIQQLPKGAMRAHINIRDVFFQLSSVTGAATSLSGFLYYQDAQRIQHAIAAYSANNLAVGSIQVTNLWNTTLITENVITDGGPPDIGLFAAETTQLTLGGATQVNVLIRANMSVLYEAL